MKTSWLVILIGIFVLLAVGLAGASVIYVKADATGGNTGLAWPNAYVDLQSALASAQPGDEIWVAAGTYKPTADANRTKSFVMKAGVSLYGGFAGGETMRDESDYNAHVTILSGDIGTSGSAADNSYHVLVGASYAVINGFTIRDGTGSLHGTGMINDGVSPVISNCIFSDNTNDSSGGGMYNANKATPLISHCIFKDNKTNYGNGAGMDNENASPNVSYCTFIQNTIKPGSTGYSGGGMSNINSSAIISYCTFQSNSASQEGGGLYSSEGSPIVANCNFMDNKAYEGGGMNINSGLVSNCYFSGNNAYGAGGMMAFSGYQNSINITNCIFNGNSSSSFGGGLQCGNTVNLSNCLFTGNTSIFGGGATINSGKAINCSFFNNTANLGGGVPLIVNSIFWGANTISIDVTCHPTFSHCNIQSSGGSGDSWDLALGIDGGGNIDADPKFVNSANPAGADGIWWTVDDGLALQTGSPCINAGTSTGAPGTDILGNLRNGAPDLGAYEYQGIVPTPTPSPTHTPTPSPTPTPTPRPADVTILSPLGGEVWVGGELEPVYWRSNILTAGTAVRFELWNLDSRMTDLGYGYSPSGEATDYILVPLLFDSTQYSIHACSLWNPYLWAESAEFTITGSPVKVESPENGAVWPVGTKQMIHWEANRDIAGTGVRFELWRGQAKDAKKIATLQLCASDKNSDLGYGWDLDGEDVDWVTVPAVAPGTDYSIRVVSTWNPVYWSQNNGFITISAGE